MKRQADRQITDRDVESDGEEAAGGAAAPPPPPSQGTFARASEAALAGRPIRQMRKPRRALGEEGGGGAGVPMFPGPKATPFAPPPVGGPAFSFAPPQPSASVPGGSTSGPTTAAAPATSKGPSVTPTPPTIKQAARLLDLNRALVRALEDVGAATKPLDLSSWCRAYLSHAKEIVETFEKVAAMGQGATASLPRSPTLSAPKPALGSVPLGGEVTEKARDQPTSASTPAPKSGPPTFQFSSVATPTTAPSSFSFAAKPADASAPAAPTFSLGGKSAETPALAVPTFSFAAKSAEAPTPPVPTFSFGAKPAEAPAPPTPTFSFGAKPAEAPAPPTPTFSFGAKPADAPAPPTPTFSFGAKVPDAKAVSVPTAQAPSFSFGSPTKATVPSFSFGAGATGAAGSKPPSKEAAPPSFSFARLGPAPATASATGDKAPAFPTFGLPAPPLPSFLAPPTLAPVAPAAGVDEEGEGGEGGDDDATALPAEEQVGDALMQGAGEEEEDTRFTVKCKLFQRNPNPGHDPKNAWEPIGVGPLKLNVHRTSGRCRILLRAEGSGRILLNTLLFQGMPVKRVVDGGKDLQFSIVDPATSGLVMRLARVKQPADAEEMLRVMREFV